MHMNEKAKKKTVSHSLNQQPLPPTSDDGKIRNWGSTRRVWTDPVLTRRDGVIRYRALLKCTPRESVSCTSDTRTATTAFEMRSVPPDWISGLRGHEATCCTAGFNEEIRKEDGRRWEGGTYVSLSKSTGGPHNTTTSAAFSVFLLTWSFKTVSSSCVCTGLF